MRVIYEKLMQANVPLLRWCFCDILAIEAFDRQQPDLANTSIWSKTIFRRLFLPEEH